MSSETKLYYPCQKALILNTTSWNKGSFSALGTQFPAYCASFEKLPPVFIDEKRFTIMTEVKLSRFYYSTVCFKVGQECCCRIDKKSSSGDVRPQFIETRWKPRNLNRNLGGLFRGLDENLVAIFKLPKLLLVRYFTKIQSSILSDTKACHCKRWCECLLKTKSFVSKSQQRARWSDQ